MSRFDFGNLEAEPSSLADMYRVLGDAQGSVHACSYMVPAELQTREYAEAALGMVNAPDVAVVRAGTRMLREAR